jgi:hypothetical protein
MKGFINNDYVVSGISLRLLQVSIPSEQIGFIEDILNPKVSEKRRYDAIQSISPSLGKKRVEIEELFGFDSFYLQHVSMLDNDLEKCIQGWDPNC